MTVATAVNEEGATGQQRGASGSARSTYSLDHMSDDDEAGPSHVVPGQPITVNQLAAALTATGGGPPIVPVAGPAVTSAQLDQLRDMGITDEAAARQALEATGGDINAAVELLFGDGNM